MNNQILIKNGIVYDPLNNVNGEVMDLAIKNGKIVSVNEIDESKAKVIDASGKVVMPGGVDLHSHIAGPKVNLGRLMRPEDHYYHVFKLIPGIRRSGTGYTVPSTTIIGYQYAEMGYTTVIEPASPPLKNRHTHEELDDTPIIDKAVFILMDSNWFVLKYLENKDYEKCAAFVAWLLNATKGYAIKLVDPGVAIPWIRGKGYGLDLDEQIPLFNLTPREIVRGLCKVNEMLKLPHPIHVHCNRLGIPGNWVTTINTMKAVSDLAHEDKVVMHVTHIQFNSYGGVGWGNFKSRAEEISKYVNSVNHVTLDLGQIIFGEATTMTGDAPFEFALYHMTKWKWGGAEVEGECAAGVVPFIYREKNYVNAVQWCIGLETALLVKDPWKIVLTTDHPNGGPFQKYPEVISWLMSKKAREEVIDKLSKRALKAVALPTIDREYDLYEITVITRAGPAKLLGLNNKGHLGIGADADVAIYDINPREVDLSKNPKLIVKAFSKAVYTIKNGEIIVKNGEIVKHTFGTTYYVKAKVEQELMNEVIKEIRERFKEWYTVSFDNYEIMDHEIRHLQAITAGGE